LTIDDAPTRSVVEEDPPNEPTISAGYCEDPQNEPSPPQVEEIPHGPPSIVKSLILAIALIVLLATAIRGHRKPLVAIGPGDAPRHTLENQWAAGPGGPSPATGHPIVNAGDRLVMAPAARAQTGISDEPGGDSGRLVVEWRGSAVPCRVPP
jgi:hypothetical protein